jgi:endonuclease G
MKTIENFLSQIDRVTSRGSNVITDQPLSPALSSPENEVDCSQLATYVLHQPSDLKKFISDGLMRERVIKGEDILDSAYLELGVIAARCVGRINIIAERGEDGYGTGFLISPNILITNNHVLADMQTSASSYIEFDYEKGTDGLPKSVKVFRFAPHKLFYTNVLFDYTIVWVEDLNTNGNVALKDFGFLKLNPQLGKTKQGNYVSIIQHPDGKMKKVALRENRVTNLDLPIFIRYVTDTKSGSSGAPVFNDTWEVVALHHSGIPEYNDANQILNLQGEPWDISQGESQIRWIENEGVRVSSIIYDITVNAAVQFPFLLDYFTPITDMEILGKSLGIASQEFTENTYYPKVEDEKDRDIYYKGMAMESVEFTKLHELLEKTHTKPLKYNPSAHLYPKIELYPDGLIRSIYSDKTYTAQELILFDKKVDLDRELAFIQLSKEKSLSLMSFNEKVDSLESSLPYNCEHVVCQSWFGKKEPMKGDLHHLFACESNCNSFRNNHIYFDFPNYDPLQTAAIEKDRLKCGYLEQDRFEPENNKGIVARAVLYFLVRYPKAISKYKSTDITMLKLWSKKQGVGNYERHRNREIYLSQGNRNPFIDFPGLEEEMDFSLAI